MALDTLRVHKLRSFLMLLGIILSVSTLIIVIALISGVNKYIANRVANLGSNVFLVARFPIITEVNEYAKAVRRNKIITWDDYESLRDNLKLPLRVGAEVRTGGTVRVGTHNIDDTSIRGVTANMGQIDVQEPADGRYITEADDSHRAMVTMIGADLGTKLFPGVDPVGREVLINGRPYMVVGVAKPIGSVLGQTQDNFVYVPMQTFIKVFGVRDGVWINIQARGAEWMERSQDEARVLMRARRHLRPDETDSFGILDSATLMDLWKRLTGVIAMAMVGVVSVFLVIGGGSRQASLACLARERRLGNMRFLPTQPAELLPQMLASADVFVFTSKPGVGKTSFPSRIYNFLLAARPVVASVDENSDLAQVLRAGAAGLVTAPGNVDDLCRALTTLYHDAALREQLGRRGAEFMARHYSSRAVVEQYETLLEGLADRSR